METRKVRDQQKRFIYLMSIYLENGFSMQSCFQLIKRGNQISANYLREMSERLNQGKELAEIFQALHFSPQIIAQIQLAQIHGNLPLTFKSINHQMKIQHERLQKMQQILAYPMLLLVFLVGMFVMMRFLLLPQFLESGMVSKEQLMIRLVWLSPYLFLALFIGICGIYFWQKIFWQRLPVLKKVQFYSKIPFVKSFIQLYFTSYFASEWGLLLQQGLELKQIIHCMERLERHSFMYELSQDVAHKLMSGLTLQQALANESFFTPEFTQILFQGEAIGDLGKELTIYSRLSLENYQQKLQTWMQWIQPAVFLLVAILVLGMYLSLLMPVYSQIGQFS